MKSTEDAIRESRRVGIDQASEGMFGARLELAIDMTRLGPIENIGSFVFSPPNHG